MLKSKRLLCVGISIAMCLSLCIVPSFAVVGEAIGMGAMIAGGLGLGIGFGTSAIFDPLDPLGWEQWDSYSEPFVSNAYTDWYSYYNSQPMVSYDPAKGTMNLGADEAKFLAGFYEPKFADGLLSWSPPSLNISQYDYGWVVNNSTYCTVEFDDGIPVSALCNDYYGSRGTSSLRCQYIDVESGDVVTIDSIPDHVNGQGAYLNTYDLWAYINGWIRVIPGGTDSQSYVIPNGCTQIHIRANIVCNKSYNTHMTSPTPITNNDWFHNPLHFESGITDVSADWNSEFFLQDGSLNTDLIHEWGNLSSNQSVSIQFYDDDGNQLFTGLTPPMFQDAMVQTVLTGERIHARAITLDTPVDTPKDDTAIGLTWIQKIHNLLQEVKEAILSIPQAIATYIVPEEFDALFGNGGGGLGLANGFLSIWHYVVSFVASLGAGLGVFMAIWSNLPYAIVVPVYASAVVVIVVTIYKRYIA